MPSGNAIDIVNVPKIEMSIWMLARTRVMVVVVVMRVTIRVTMKIDHMRQELYANPMRLNPSTK